MPLKFSTNAQCLTWGTLDWCHDFDLQCKVFFVCFFYIQLKLVRQHSADLMYLLLFLFLILGGRFQHHRQLPFQVVLANL